MTGGPGTLRRRLTAVAAVVSVVLLVPLTACTPEAGEPSATPERTLAVAASTAPTGLDPFTSPEPSIPQALLYNVYETLLKVDSEGALQPLLAQGWEISPDRLTYTFLLNPAAAFASGRPVDGASVKAGFDRLRADSALSRTLSADLALISTVEAPEDHKVVFTLARPSQTWLYAMASTMGMVVDPGFSGSLSSASAGSGPFAVKALTAGSSLVLSRNESYWGTPARFDEVTFHYLPNAEDQTSALLDDEVDIIASLPYPDSLAQFADTARFTTLQGTTTSEVVLGFNHSHKALANLKVRQALARAVDKESINQEVFGGGATVIGSMAVPSDPWFEDLSLVNAHDPATAEDLLSEGLKEAEVKKPLKLKLRVPQDSRLQSSATLVAEQLEAVGVEVTVEELSTAEWLTEVFTDGDFDLTLAIQPESRDLVRFADPQYYWHYDSAGFRTLFSNADQAADEESSALMGQAVRYLADDAAAVWLVALPNITVTDERISGVPASTAGLSFDLTTVASR